jgi:signal peptidase II
LGGAAGNLIDRMVHSKVVDFIEVNLYKQDNGIWVPWPTFNVADIAICVGVGLMALDFLFPKQKVIPKPRPQPETVNEKAT